MFKAIKFESEALILEKITTKGKPTQLELKVHSKSKRFWMKPTETTPDLRNLEDSVLGKWLRCLVGLLQNADINVHVGALMGPW